MEEKILIWRECSTMDFYADGNTNIIEENYKGRKSEIHHFAFGRIIVNHDEECTMPKFIKIDDNI